MIDVAKQSIDLFYLQESNDLHLTTHVSSSSFPLHFSSIMNIDDSQL